MARTLTLDEIDKLFASWQSKRDIASRNVLELMDLPSYQHLTSVSAKANKLTGVTEARCTPALKALGELWGLFAELGKVLDLAAAKRAALPARPKAVQLDEITELLSGASIKNTVQLPFAERSLLTPAEAASGLTLDRVMETMCKAYDEGKAVVLEIDQAITRLHDSLENSIAEVKMLRTLAQSLGEGDLLELDAVDSKVAAALNLVFCDPLGVKVGLDTEVAPVLKLARERVNGLKEIYEQIKRDLALARITMTSLSETQLKASQAEAERKLKVWLENGDQLPSPPDAAAIKAIEEWLVRLENNLAQNKWKPLRFGVANWSIQATERLLACQVACTANLSPLTQRQELRGYLDALIVKAQTYGRSEEAELARIEKAARALLYNRPTRLAEAEQLVQQYAGNLR